MPLLGYDTESGNEVSLGDTERRSSLYVLGKPGTGKSTLLLNRRGSKSAISRLHQIRPKPRQTRVSAFRVLPCFEPRHISGCSQAGSGIVETASKSGATAFPRKSRMAELFASPPLRQGQMSSRQTRSGTSPNRGPKPCLIMTLTGQCAAIMV